MFKMICFSGEAYSSLDDIPFGRHSGSTVVLVPEKEDFDYYELREIKEVLEQNGKLAAIKLARQLTQCGLLESKLFVENLNVV